MDGLVYAFGAFGEYASAADVPTEFRLLMPGENETQIGKLIFDSEGATAAMAKWQARGIDLMADYEHQSLHVPPIEAPASAKKWVPQVRNGELWATSINWTDKARAYIANGEYRYFSIACRLEAKTRRVVEFLNFALTNLPAADNIQALVAASLTSQTEQEDMKTLIVALGLRADASESDALTAVSRLRDLEREVLALTGKGELAEAIGTMRANAQAHSQLVALSAQVAQLQAEKRGADFDKVITAGVSEGKLTPAMLDASKSEFGRWVATLRAKEDGVMQLSATVAALPKQVPTEEHKEPPDDRVTANAVTFGKDEVEVAARFGIDLEKIADVRLHKKQSPVTKHANGTVTIRSAK